MPARSTSKATSPEKKATKAAAKKPAAKKKPAAASKAKPSARKAPASKGKAAAPKRSAKPGTITVGETQYVLGEYGQLMTMDEYELVMGKKLSG